MDPVMSLVMALAAGAAPGLKPMGGQVIVCLPTGDIHGHL
jgi:hypothetical protein